jgi:hypothetical protein
VDLLTYIEEAKYCPDLQDFVTYLQLSIMVYHRVLVRKLEGRRPLGKPRRRWEDNINMDLQEAGCGGYGLDRAGSGQGQVEGTCEYVNELSGSIKRGEFLD